MYFCVQIASIGDVSDCTFLSNTATTGPAVYAFNCAGQIYNNAFANEPFDAVRCHEVRNANYQFSPGLYAV